MRLIYVMLFIMPLISCKKEIKEVKKAKRSKPNFENATVRMIGGVEDPEFWDKLIEETEIIQEEVIKLKAIDKEVFNESIEKMKKENIALRKTQQKFRTVRLAKSRELLADDAKYLAYVNQLKLYKQEQRKRK